MRISGLLNGAAEERRYTTAVIGETIIAAISAFTMAAAGLGKFRFVATE
jgi:hypothetical protein